MTTYYLNGNPINEGSDITLNGMTYPYSWLEGTSPQLRASYGIEVSGDINYYDTKYYWGIDTPKNLNDVEEVDEKGDPLFVKIWNASTQTTIDTEVRVVSKGLKTTCAEEVKNITNNLLKPTDYLIIRNEVESVEIPESIVTYRAAVITESDRVVTAIAASTTLAGLIGVMSSIAWPVAE